MSEKHSSLLTVIGAGKDNRHVLCRCECGTVREFVKRDVRSGHSKSCGCYRSKVCGDRFRKHGCHDTPEYKAWAQMKTRCSDPEHTQYGDYGGRGIRVCDRWLKFESFLADIGPRPSVQHSLDRIDNDGGYWCGKSECAECGPADRVENCRWATRRQQAKNRRSTVLIEFRGRSMCLIEWAVELGLRHQTLSWRIDVWGVERALTTPRRNYPTRGREFNA